MSWRVTISIIFLMTSTSVLAQSPEEMEQRYERETKQLEALVQELQERKLAMKKMDSLDDQKNAVLIHIDEVLREKNQLILNYMNLNRELKKKAQEDRLSFNHRLQLEIKKRGLAGELDHSSQKIVGLETKLSQQQREMAILKNQLERQELEHLGSIERMHAHVEQLQASLSRRSPASMPTEEFHALSQKMETVRTLHSQVDAKARELLEYEQKLELKNKQVQQLLVVNSDLSQALFKAEQSLDYLIKQNAKLEADLAIKTQEYAELERYTQELEQAREIQVHQLEAQLAQVGPSQSGRAPSSLAPSDLAEQFNQWLNSEKIRVHALDDQHLRVSFSEEFFFSNDHFSLSRENQQQLEKFFQLYGESFLGHQAIESKLESIEFIGHASPWYQGRFIDPLSSQTEAYQHNLQLSLERARSFARFIFSEDFIDFPNKNLMRAKTKISGKSFSEPVAMRQPASTFSLCGPYDCQRSRRVEIVFIFVQD